MGDWAIDSYGLRDAHRHSVLDRLQETDRLHVSPLTWQSPDVASSGSLNSSISSADMSYGWISMVDSGDGHTPSRTTTLAAQLYELHGRGVLVPAGEHECDPGHVADFEASWKSAGLIGRPTDETLTAVLTADRLGVELITSDIDVQRLADYWQVRALTVPDFASALAA